jgi:tetratricopeptide (TPR) repeat protein
VPVLGHAFVGLATAVSTKPAGKPSLAQAFWVPVVVSLAYLPDIAAQVVALAEGGRRTAVTHSLLFALFASTMVAAPLAAGARISLRRALAVSLLCIIGHLILDLLQADDRALLWPMVDWNFGLGLVIIPNNSVQEALLFGGLFGAFLLGRFVVLRRRASSRGAAKVARQDHGWAPWVGRLAAAAILLLAAVTHYLRHDREEKLARARQSISERDFVEALVLLDQADRWPLPAKPGRIDYWRARAYAKLGDRDRAEQLYHRSIRDAPYFYWNLADLVLLYATADQAPEVKRRRLEPYLAQLRNRFADHERLPRLLERVERNLAPRPPAGKRPAGKSMPNESVSG